MFQAQRALHPRDRHTAAHVAADTFRLAAIVVTAAALISLLGGALVPAMAQETALLSWLRAQQNADGGFGSPQSAVGATADVVLAAANGENALGWSRAGSPTALAYLEANAAALAKAGDTAKIILALTASGQNPRDLGGVDLIAKLEAMQVDSGDEAGKIGTASDFINEHCYAMLALSSAGRRVPAAAVDYLLDRQIKDGTWSWNGGTEAGSGDNNTAAMAVIALVAAGVPADHAQILKTLAHFHGQQNEDGGFPYIKPSPYGTASDANSTAVVMWAIKAAGQDPAGTDWKYQRQDGRSPLDRLRAFQNESGAYRWQDAFADDNLASTVQAAIAAQLKTLPLARMDVGPAALESAPAEALPETGGDLWTLALSLIGSGVTLAGAGLALRKRKG
jgi:LPXTG-motif cell wall-anchored protein